MNLDELLIKIVRNPRFGYLNFWKQHVDNSMFIIPKWALAINNIEDINAECPHQKVFDGSYKSVLIEGAIYLGIEVNYGC